jgi:PBSX family phage portal protein
MHVVEDNEEGKKVPIIEKVYTLQHKSEKKDTDVFAKGDNFVKALTGTSPAFKRRVTNQINKFHAGAGGAGSKKEEQQIISGYNAFDVLMPPYNLDYLAKLYEVSSPHYAGANAKVSNIVGLGYTLVETTKTKRAIEDLEGNKDKLSKFNKKLSRAREDLNNRIEEWHQEDTFTETLIKVWKDYEATGNAYIEIGRTNRGDIGYFGHIPATTVRVRRKRDGFVQIISNKAVYFRNFGDRKTADPIGNDRNPNEVIHLKKYAPSNGFYGIPDIVAAKQAVAGNEFAARFNLDYFENKAVPRHVITLKGAELGTAALASLMELFETGMKGVNHRSVFIPLPGDDPDGSKVEFKIDAIESGVQDSSFNNYRKANVSDILMVHGVPVSKVSLSEGISLAAAKDADKTFKEQVCQPQQKILEKKLNRVLAEVTDIFQFKLNELALTDENTQAMIWERAVRNGWILPNEIRAETGRPPIKDGDIIGGAQGAQKKAEQKANAQATRERDAERSAAASDTTGEARQPKGEGRAAQ